MKHSFNARAEGAGRDGKQHSFIVEVPVTLNDEALIEARFGTVERMIADAVANWTVSCQNNGLRKLIATGDMEGAKKFAETYQSGQKAAKVIVKAKKLDPAEAKKQKFTPEQIAFLTAQGML